MNASSAGAVSNQRIDPPAADPARAPGRAMRHRPTRARAWTAYAAAAFALGAALCSVGASSVAAQTIVKIAWIDPLSGPMATFGRNQLLSYQHVTEIANREKWAGELDGSEVRFEIVPFDGKLDPRESAAALQTAIGQGIRFVAQGSSSAVALTLTEAINAHNASAPGKELLFINYAAVAPALTNEQCSFWHFSFDLNADMKMEALTAYMAKRPEIRKVYLINPDYALGESVEQAALAGLKRKRPEIEIVGKERHPLAEVRDFGPHVKRIRDSGADTVITSDWGADLVGLVRAAREAGLEARFYTYYAYGSDVVREVGEAGIDRLRYVGDWNPNDPAFDISPLLNSFRERHGEDFFQISTYTSIRMLADAVRKAKSIDPVRLAFAMEGMLSFSLNGGVWMRASDHQLHQVSYVASLQPVDGKAVRFDQSGTGLGWRTESKMEWAVSSRPTTCRMQRPAQP